MTDTALIVKRVLSDENIAQVRELEAACRQADGIRVKFNWELIAERDPADVQNFCWYEDGRIVGYAQIDRSGDEAEVTGAVLPACRRRGIFRRLFEAAHAQVRHWECRQLLLVSYPRCPAGVAAARRLGATHRFSEYRMEADDPAVPPRPAASFGCEKRRRTTFWNWPG